MDPLPDELVEQITDHFRNPIENLHLRLVCRAWARTIRRGRRISASTYAAHVIRRGWGHLLQEYDVHAYDPVVIEAAIAIGDQRLVEWLCERGCHVNEHVMIVVARYDRTDICVLLESLFQRRWLLMPYERMLVEAAKCHSLSMLDHMRPHFKRLDVDSRDEMIDGAARRGHMRVLRLLNADKRFLITGDAMLAAIRGRHANVLAYCASDSGCGRFMKKMDRWTHCISQVVRAAVETGRLEFIRHVVPSLFGVDTADTVNRMYIEVGSSAHVDAIRWLCRHGAAHGCSIFVAVRHGSLVVAQCLYDAGKRAPEDRLLRACQTREATEWVKVHDWTSFLLSLPPPPLS